MSYCTIALMEKRVSSLLAQAIQNESDLGNYSAWYEQRCLAAASALAMVSLTTYLG